MALARPNHFAAFDIGSNGVRLFVGRSHGRKVEVLEDVRASIRLGAEVFRHGLISTAQTERLVHCFLDFRRRALQRGVLHWRAVATSALRDARNRAEVVQTIWQHTGIQVEVIDGLEEARLLFRAVKSVLEIDLKRALLMDMGGGSLEVVAVDRGRMTHAQSLRLGAVRLMNRCGVDAPYGNYAQIIRRELGRLAADCDPIVDLISADYLVGTGGCLRAMARLSGDLNDRKTPARLSLADMEELNHLIFSLPVERRVQALGLRPDRADIIRPALAVIIEVMRHFNFNHLQVPNVGIKNGIFWDLADSLRSGGERPIHQRENHSANRQT